MDKVVRISAFDGDAVKQRTKAKNAANILFIMSDVIAEPSPRSNRDLIRKIRLIEGDLTKQTDVGAIVGLISSTLRIDGTLMQALIQAAGEQLDDFIVENIYKPRAGDVFPVPAFTLPVAHLIFAVTPDWNSGIDLEDRDLIRAYRGAMQMARFLKVTRVAFPALGTGKRKYPIKRAARLGLQGILDRMTPEFEEVRIVCNRPETYEAFQEWLEYYAGKS